MTEYRHHTPFHLFVDDTPYFITGAIYMKRLLLSKPSLKHRLFELIKWYFEKYNWELHHWVILNNHYHILGKSRKGEDLPLIIQGIHRESAKKIQKENNVGRPVWWNYWDYCPRNEKDYLTRMNYLLYNPVKHGYTNNLNHYLFSSFHDLLTKVGRERLVRQFREFPAYKSMVLLENADQY